MLFGKKWKNISLDKMKQALNPIIYTKIYYYTHILTLILK